MIKNFKCSKCGGFFIPYFELKDGVCNVCKNKNTTGSFAFFFKKKKKELKTKFKEFKKSFELTVYLFNELGHKRFFDMAKRC